jgi:DNA-binding MarR family transcriptional regulator
MIKRKARPDALDELFFHLGRAYFNYKLLLERTLRELGLDRLVSPGMGHLLFSLFEKDDVIIRELVERTRLSFPTITMMLRKMEKAGLVASRRDPEDGRSVRIRLTPLGRSIEGRCWKAVARIHAVVESGLGRREAAVARKVLARMTENMRKEAL